MYDIRPGVSSKTDNKDLPDEFPRQPEEWFLEVIVRFRRNFIVLEVLFSVESHGAGLNFSLLPKGHYG